MQLIKNQKPFCFRQNLTVRGLCFFLLGTFSLVFLGCHKPQLLIAGTQIPATPANIKVLQQVDSYFLAMQQRDITKLRAMAHASFQSNSGTPDPGDDYNLKGLEEILKKRLLLIRSIQYTVKYKEVLIEGDIARVRLKYDAHFQLATEQGDLWHDSQFDKEMKLKLDGDQWLFISGY